jgi:hypothetical protein
MVIDSWRVTDSDNRDAQNQDMRDDRNHEESWLGA